MMNQTLFMSEDELQILFNLFDSSLKVSYPFYDFTLFSAYLRDLGAKVDVKCTEQEFQMNQTQFGPSYMEMPAYTDLLDVLLYSGIITYDNIFLLDTLVDDVLKWPETRKAVFVPDTNLFYHVFFRNYQKIKPGNVVVVDTCGEEIDAARNHQLSTTVFESIKKRIPRQKEWYEPLAHTLTKKSRRAQHLAYMEYEQVKHHAVQMVNAVRPSEADNDANDQTIVDTADAIKKERYPDLYVLTADAGVADRCEEKDLLCILLKIPRVLSSMDGSIEQFRSMIAALARVFGVIKLNSTLIYGDFMDKTQQNYDKLMVMFHHQQRYEECKKHLDICRKICEIGIPVGE